MKRMIFIILIVIPTLLMGQPQFNDYFTGKSLRFDFLLGGNHETIQVYPEQIKQESHWAGPRVNLTDPFDYGSYRFQVFDEASGTLIFSKGFSTLFQEWQTTGEAKVSERTFYQSAIFPYPKRKVRLEIHARQWEGHFESIYQTRIDPGNYFILSENSYSFDTHKILDNGKPENKVDLLILAEGYTENEGKKFLMDAERVTKMLFSEEPFKTEKHHFNVTAIHPASLESGTDIPGEHIYKNTYFNSTFFTFDLDRYLTTSDMKKIYDVAGTVPYDHIYILVNSEKYGGGGIYNFLSICTSDNALTPQVFIHEFGHGMAGLGDEYYSSSVAYEDFYNLETEPWEPNLTTLVNFEQKWKDMISEETPVPTPRSAKYNETVGVYEGGGYLSTGIYSPYIDCRMKSNTASGFCPVCQEAIRRVIRYYTDR